ncbi:MAG: HIT domain-containing protein [Helicobacteraceae bacterium]|jgi:diadenosine tetraphosphate (Ap4A) HIT family hydrolase|nr:HIT domain-containing protein [Helicobacteraceae bacterium]
MDYLYAPWRSGYHGSKYDGCVFCDISQRPENDTKNHVLFRNEHCFIVMNLYPYMPGHFMIVPHAHTDALEELSAESWQNITALARNGARLLKRHFGAKGVNLGMNLGVAGGAGIAEHIHLHLVPRWIGDTNFATAIGDFRVYGVQFDKIYEQLLEKAGEYFNA